jgi:hypothetical protein
MASNPSANFPNTWEGVTAAATAAGAKYPELLAAQWALESGWGKSTSGKNNYFGIKGEGTTCKTTEFVNGARVHIEAEFMDFADLGACVSYLVTRWYKDFKGYKGVNGAADRELAAKQLVKEGYATDPSYAEKLIKLMAEKAPKGQSQGKSQASKPQSKGGSVLFKIKASQDTWLKKEPEQVADLEDDQKVAVAWGKEYAVSAYTEVPANGHAQVELGGGAGTWFVFESHWQKETPAGKAQSSSVDWSDFGCLVTPSLTVGEILQWDKRRTPPSTSANRARLLRTAAEFQKIREAWGSPLGVTSFYRPEPINSQVGGVPGSKHVSGEAMDVYPSTRSLEEFYQWIRRRWTGGLGDGRNRGFIHLDTRGGGGFVPGAGVGPCAEWLY